MHKITIKITVIFLCSLVRQVGWVEDCYHLLHEAPNGCEIYNLFSLFLITNKPASKILITKSGKLF